jgi:hypothetical protein
LFPGRRITAVQGKDSKPSGFGQPRTSSSVSTHHYQFLKRVPGNDLWVEEAICFHKDPFPSSTGFWVLPAIDDFDKIGQEIYFGPDLLSIFSGGLRKINGLRRLEEGIVFAYDDLTGGFDHENPCGSFDRVLRFSLFPVHSNLPMRRSASF